MKNGKRLLAIPLAIVLVGMLSGCVSITINQEIKTNGDSKVELVYDFTALSEMAKGFEEKGMKTEGTDTLSQLKETCPDFKKENKWKDSTCKVEGSKVILGGTIPAKEDNKLKISRSLFFTKYRYNINGSFDVLSEGAKTEGEKFSEKNLSEAKAMSSMGVKFQYILQLPGKISKADIGEIKNKNQVEINLFDLVDKKDVYVESREINISNIVITLAVVMGGIILGIVLVLKKRAGAKEAVVADQSSGEGAVQAVQSVTSQENISAPQQSEAPKENK